MDGMNHRWQALVTLGRKMSDLAMDEDLLDHESIKIPQLHSKYLNWLSDVRLFKIKKEQEYKRLLREKFEYYTGKSDAEVYKQKPFDLKIKVVGLTIFECFYKMEHGSGG